MKFTNNSKTVIAISANFTFGFGISAERGLIYKSRMLNIDSQMIIHFLAFDPTTQQYKKFKNKQSCFNPS
jgi:hypothetical protein